MSEINKLRWSQGLITRKDCDNVIDVRRGLIQAGLMPEKYSEENIREVLSNGELPDGWTVQDTYYQGFITKLERLLFDIIELNNNCHMEQRVISGKPRTTK